MNGVPRTQSENARLDPLSLVICQVALHKERRWSKRVLTFDRSPALPNLWLILILGKTVSSSNNKKGIVENTRS